MLFSLLCKSTVQLKYVCPIVVVIIIMILSINSKQAEGLFLFFSLEVLASHEHQTSPPYLAGEKSYTLNMKRFKLTSEEAFGYMEGLGFA